MVCSMYIHFYEYIFFVSIIYIYVHALIYLYVHDAGTSVQLHNPASLLIRPDQPCYAGESQLRAGSSPSEQPPSCHLSPQLTDHPGAACLVQTATATGLPRTHCFHACHPLLQCHSYALGSLTSCAGCTGGEW
jgi:hypothetical protein